MCYTHIIEVVTSVPLGPEVIKAAQTFKEEALSENIVSITTHINKKSGK